VPQVSSAVLRGASPSLHRAMRARTATAAQACEARKVSAKRNSFLIWRLQDARHCLREERSGKARQVRQDKPVPSHAAIACVRKAPRPDGPVSVGPASAARRLGYSSREAFASRDASRRSQAAFLKTTGPCFRDPSAPYARQHAPPGRSPRAFLPALRSLHSSHSRQRVIVRADGDPWLPGPSGCEAETAGAAPSPSSNASRERPL